MFNSQDMFLREGCLELSPLEEKASPKQQYRYPRVVEAIHHLASLRNGEAKAEGYLSAQVNRAKRLQAHKDKKHHSTPWLVALGDFAGGRVWLEDPLGQHPPPCVTSGWHKSGTRTSVTVFSPRSWKRIPPHALTELADCRGFTPPISAMRAKQQELEGLKGEAEEEDEDIWMDSPPVDEQQRFVNSIPRGGSHLARMVQSRSCVTSDKNFECVRWVH